MAGSFRPWAPLIVPPQLNGRVLEILLPALVLIDRDFLEEHPKVPLLYESGVRYQAEAPGEEKWLTVPWNLLAMAGDCEDLAAWRCAELQLGRGTTDGRPENAECVYVEQKTPQGLLYHIQVRRADGRIEDPSLVLGMGWEKDFIKKYGPNHGITDMDEPWKQVAPRAAAHDVARMLSEIRSGTVGRW